LHPSSCPPRRSSDLEPITVRWCPSVLSLWDALTGWDEQGWLVLLTDRTEEEIGSGLLARMVQQRLHRPDAWDSVKQRFRATSLEDRKSTRLNSSHVS